MVVKQGLALRARELRANSSALGEVLHREQRRLGRGECRRLSGGPGLRGPSGSGHVWGFVGCYSESQGDGCCVWEPCSPVALHVHP